MSKRLLVALSHFSRTSPALQYAAVIARANGSVVDLVTVNEPRGFDPSRVDTPPVHDILCGEQLRCAADYLKNMGVTHIVTSLLTGAPSAAIVAHAERTTADLILVESRGHTGLKRLWSHSTADQLIRNSGKPVLVVRTNAPAQQASALLHSDSRLLVTIDAEENDPAIVPHVVALAQTFGAEVHLLSVVTPALNGPAFMAAALDAPDLRAYAPDIPAFVDAGTTACRMQCASGKLARIMQAVEREHGGAVYMHLVKDFDVPGAIADFALNHSIDLVGLTTSGRGLSRLFVDSVMDRLLKRTDLPILAMGNAEVQVSAPQDGCREFFTEHFALAAPTQFTQA